MDYRKPRGTSEILPNEFPGWQNVNHCFSKICEVFCFERIITPSFEFALLFDRSLGAETDIVSKEMFVFEDRKNRKLALRPEATAGIVRSITENKLLEEHKLPLKLAYWENMFRYDRPQKGRNREFWQCGGEIFDRNNIANDIEIISMIVTFFGMLKIKNWKLKINFIGSNDCKLKYSNHISNVLADKIIYFCGDCQRRIKSNPLKILDCKMDHDNEHLLLVQNIGSFLSEDEKMRFSAIQILLKNLNIGSFHWK